ncbi:MAG: permease-like cell division protein FtsX [Clostridiales bacterium]|nr:permease-like cell division protein FtsX [Clostridiales bacterium]
MRPSTIWYTLKQGFKNIKRNWMFSLACIITMAACIFLVGIFYSIVNNVGNIAHKVEEEVPITVFFDEGTSEEEIQAIGDAIQSRPEVARMDYQSADQAWEEYKQKYFGDEDAAVNQSEQASRTLGSINKLVSYVSIAVIAILLIISIFLISNTVSMGISVRKEEIGIMKYIGATDAFVRLPFLLEGMILGVIGAAIPLICLFFLYNSAVEFILTKFNVLTGIVDFIPIWQIYEGLVPMGLGLGVGIGLLGSFFTTRKHLRV